MKDRLIKTFGYLQQLQKPEDPRRFRKSEQNNKWISEEDNELFKLLAYIMADENTKKIIGEDVDRNLKWDHIDSTSRIKRLMICLKKVDYRNVYYYRLKNANKAARVLIKIENMIWPFDKTVEIVGDIKGGLLVSHCLSMIGPSKAGKNLRVGPGAVIGRMGKDFPVIGDNVYIAANATVIGDVKIGNNVIIGAGSVVVKDIPDNSVAVGNPAHVIRPIKESDYNEIM